MAIFHSYGGPTHHDGFWPSKIWRFKFWTINDHQTRWGVEEIQLGAVINRYQWTVLEVDNIEVNTPYKTCPIGQYWRKFMKILYPPTKYHLWCWKVAIVCPNGPRLACLKIGYSFYSTFDLKCLELLNSMLNVLHPSYIHILHYTFMAYIWVNYNNSSTWIKAILVWFLLLTIIPVRS